MAPHHVNWIPGSVDQLLTWSTEIGLYRIRERPLPSYQLLDDISHRISPANVAEIQQLIPEPPHYIKCVSLCPESFPSPTGDDGRDIRFAVGQANGRIDIMSFLEQTRDYGNGTSEKTHTLKELSPKVLRQCNDLAWNPSPSHHNLIAAGYDKVRADSAILVFDINREPSVAVSNPSTTSSISRFSLSTSIAGGSSASLAAKAAASNDKLEFVRPIADCGLGEHCHSLAWFRDQPKCLLAGMNQKVLRVFDIRIEGGSGGWNSKPTLNTFTRAVYGVCVDPYLDHRVASIQDNQVVIWDTRNFEKPIVTLTQAAKVIHLEWSPNRAGLLCSSVENSHQLTIHDIQSWPIVSELGEAAVTERTVQGWLDIGVPPKQDFSNLSLQESSTSSPSRSVESPRDAVGGTAGAVTTVAEEKEEKELGRAQQPNAFTSFAWHPSKEKVIVAVLSNGRLSEVKVHDRISPSWSFNHCLLWPHGGKLRIFDNIYNNALYNNIEDISVIMQDRAKTSYGALAELKDNATHCSSNSEPSLSWAWHWLEGTELLMQDLEFRNKFSRSCTIPGVRTALGLDRKPGILLRADIGYQSWNGVATTSPMSSAPQSSSSSSSGRVKLYKTESRSIAQKICGWSMDFNDLNSFVQQCETRGEYTRAAATAVFCLDMRLALSILSRGSAIVEETDPNMSASLNMTALSLAGFRLDKPGSSVWRELVKKNSAQITDPYLRAVFAFLTAENENYSGVLEEPDLQLSDKVCFALQYLTDDALVESLKGFWQDLRAKGDLRALILCGMGEEAIGLLQKYLDRTGDVQTVCWLMIRCFPADLVKESSECQEWIESYKDLLDAWEMYGPRGELDGAINDAGMTIKPPLQVYVSCNFCGSSVGHHIKGMPSRSEARTASLGRTASAARSQTRVQACPACRKHLARCSVCSNIMGSHSGQLLQDNPPAPNAPVVTQLSEFFSWCQTCRHGGHAGHLADWFEDNLECPVSGCHCKCWTCDQAAFDEPKFVSTSGSNASLLLKSQVSQQSNSKK